MTAIPKPAYVISEPHLSGWRVIIGYQALSDAQDAQAAIAAPPAEGVALDRFGGLIDQAWDRLCRPKPDVPGAMVCLNAMKSAALRSTDTGEK